MSIHAIQDTDRYKRIVGIMKIGNRNVNEEQVFGGGYSAVFYNRLFVRKQRGRGLRSRPVRGTRKLFGRDDEV
jgi:endonuclease YncB( thermonuclease family)